MEIASGKLYGHFIYRAAEEVIKHFPNEKQYVAEAGFTPSGKIHLGNFNDLCITHALIQVLEFWGYNGRAIVAIDSRDPFRQAPVFAPDEFKKREEELRGLPFDEIDDPWGCHKNFAEHFIAPVVDSFRDYGLKIDAIRAHEIHNNPKYIELLKKVLVEREKVRAIINEVRKKAGHKSLYPENWIPYRPKCERCGRMDEGVIPISVSEDGRYVRYKCSHCGYEGVADVEKAQGKPPFRIDWPLRWIVFNVHFEPMGKDLMASGSSYDTGRALMQNFFNRKAPLSVFYDFFYWIPPEDARRESKLKFSKRMGVGFGMKEWLKYAAPEVLKYIVLRRQIENIYQESLKHIDFSPLDIPSYVDAYDKLEAKFYDLLSGNLKLPKPDTDRIYATYILSQVELTRLHQKKPHRIPYNVMIDAALWMESVEDGMKMLARMRQLPKGLSEREIADIRERLIRVSNWVKDFYKPSLPLIKDVLNKLSEKQKEAISVFLTNALSIDPDDLSMEKLRDLVKKVASEVGLKPKEIYQALYIIVLDKREGPPIIRLFRKDFVRDHLNKILDVLKNSE